eukprot:1339830-Amorphochlora_amoeboformis.AAC.1
MAQNGADECEDTAWERAEKFFLQFFGFETVLRNESEIKNLLETSSNPTVWASIGRRWRNLEIIGDIRSVTPMYGLVENIKEPGPNEHEIEHIKYNRRVDRLIIFHRAADQGEALMHELTPAVLPMASQATDADALEVPPTAGAHETR